MLQFIEMNLQSAMYKHYKYARYDHVEQFRSFNIAQIGVGLSNFCKYSMLYGWYMNI